MIVDYLFSFFNAVAKALVGLLPTDTIDYSKISGMWAFLGDLNYFLPISELTTFVVAILAIGPAFLTATIISWLAIGVARGGNPRA